MKLKDIFEAAPIEPMELKDVVKNFPTKYQKIFNSMWGKADVLTYKGKPLFTTGEFGPAYAGIIKAVEQKLKRGFSVDLEFRGESMEIDVTDVDGQECYLGYDPKTDTLYSGWDLWAETEEFEKAFDELYQRTEDEEFDVDSDDKKFADAWKEFRDSNASFLGGLFEMESSDGKTFHADTLEVVPGGFYKAIYKSKKKTGAPGEFSRLTLIDLRLD